MVGDVVADGDAAMADDAVTDGDAGLPPQTSFKRLWPFSFVVRSEVLLPVTRAQLWEVLVDFERYSEWNRFTPEVSTELSEGSVVVLKVHMLEKKPLLRREWVHSVVLGRRLCWGMSMGPFLRANRSQWLIEMNDAAILYRTDDVLTGLLAPLVKLLYGKRMQRGFDAVCAGLQARVGGQGA